MIGFVDTNLFNKLKRDTDGIHDKFLTSLGEQAFETRWIVPPFGWLEYLGITAKGLMGVTAKPNNWLMPEQARKQYAKIVEMHGVEFASEIYWMRSEAKAAFEAEITDQFLEQKANEDKKYHSQVFTNGPLAGVLFDYPSNTYPASDIVELLTIDFLHRFPDFPHKMAEDLRIFQRMCIVVEHQSEKRNVNLFRGAKQHWIVRNSGDHEKHIASATMKCLEAAMRELKNDADRFDHDLLAYFLLGFADDGNYEPVTVYTQDDPDQIMCRLVVFYSIIQWAWKECNEVVIVDGLRFQTHSRVCFVNDAGQVTSGITFGDLFQFMVNEELLME